MFVFESTSSSFRPRCLVSPFGVLLGREESASPGLIAGWNRPSDWSGPARRSRPQRATGPVDRRPSRGTEMLKAPRTPVVRRRDLLGTFYTDIAVRGSVDNVRNLVHSAFGAQGFEVNWAGATKGKAEKGSKGLNIAFGWLAQYYGVDFEIGPTRDGAVLRLIKSNTGWAGGYLGARKVEKKFKELGDLMASWFQQQGVLMGRRSG